MKKDLKELRRVFTSSLALKREKKDDVEVPILEGLAIATEKETILYEDGSYREIEIIADSCLDAAFLKSQDIKLNLLHDRVSTLARCNKGVGTLSLEKTDEGLRFSCPVPDCDLGQRAKALVENGTYTGCSFEFYPDDYVVIDRVGEDGKQEYVIRHRSFRSIEALTIAMDAAYKQTSIGLRESVKEEISVRKRSMDAKREKEVNELIENSIY